MNYHFEIKFLTETIPVKMSIPRGGEAWRPFREGTRRDVHIERGWGVTSISKGDGVWRPYREGVRLGLVCKTSLPRGDEACFGPYREGWLVAWFVKHLYREGTRRDVHIERGCGVAWFRKTSLPRFAIWARLWNLFMLSSTEHGISVAH